MPIERGTKQMEIFVFCIFTIDKTEREWINIGYLSSYLKRRKDIDIVVKLYNNDEIDVAIKDITALKPFAVGLTVLQNNFYTVLDFSTLIKKRLPFTTVILGNTEATAYADYIMKNYPAVDVIVHGEGEVTLYEVCDCILTHRKLIDCSGITFRTNNRIIQTKSRALIEDLDSLPYPDRSFFRSDVQAFSVVGSRGCFGRCTFCELSGIYKANKGSRVRERSIENILGEIQEFTDENKYAYFAFRDNEFESGGSCERTKLLYDALIKSKLRIQFSLYANAQTITEPYILELTRLKDVGLNRFFIGLESGSRSDLKLFGKKATLEDNENALLLLGRHNFISGISGVIFSYGYIVFHPYSTIQTLRENINFVEKYKLHVTMEIMLNRMYISGTTPITQKIIRDGLLMQSPDLPITDPFCYKFQDAKIERIYHILTDIFNKYQFLQNIPMRVLTKIAIHNKENGEYIDPMQALQVINFMDEVVIRVFNTVLEVVELGLTEILIHDMISCYADNLKREIRKLQILNAKLAVKLLKSGSIVIK